MPSIAAIARLNISRRDVMENPPSAVVVFRRERAVERVAAVTEQRFRLALRRAVRVELREDPLRPSLDVDRLARPCARARMARGIGGGERGALDPYRHLPWSSRERERTLDEQQPIVHHLADARARAQMVGIST